MTSIGSAFNFADFQGMAALRRGAAANTPEARRAAAQQFEALFLNMMLKEMRESGVDGGLFDSDRLKTYQGMYDQQLALTLARGPGIGLADAIYRQLGGEQTPPATPAGTPASSIPAAAAPASVAPVAASDFRPASAEAFIAAIRPHAQAAAARLGVDADVLMAQAALETGWGRIRSGCRTGRRASTCSASRPAPTGRGGAPR